MLNKLDKVLIRVHGWIEKRLEKKIANLSDKSPDNDFNLIVMNTKDNFHVIISQGDFSEAIPEDGSFLGAYVFTGLTQDAAKAIMQKYKDRDPEFTEA